MLCGRLNLTGGQEMWEVVSKFNAVGTSGCEYVIVEERDEAGLVGAANPVQSECRYKLSDGRALAPEKDGTFILEETGEVLKAAAPSAVPEPGK